MSDKVIIVMKYELPHRKRIADELLRDPEFSKQMPDPLCNTGGLLNICPVGSLVDDARPDPVFHKRLAAAKSCRTTSDNKRIAPFHLCPTCRRLPQQMSIVTSGNWRQQLCELA